jgi:hypothetical protein
VGLRGARPEELRRTAVAWHLRHRRSPCSPCGTLTTPVVALPHPDAAARSVRRRASSSGGSQDRANAVAREAAIIA